MRHLLLAVAGAAALAACSKAPPATEPITGGDPRAGRAQLARYGCASCHQIKGIAHADSQVGPPLDEIRSRGYIAGVLPHTADNLIKWIQHPRQVVPNTAMPELGVTAAEARDMAAYLYSQ
ncbi:MAG: c-type cytochrome [Massilia sp.]|nr:c-type cytochrome [Massilia sp.]